MDKQKVINLEKFKTELETKNGQSSDFVARIINFNNKKILYTFYSSTSSDDKISNFFMKNISDDFKYMKKDFFSNLFNSLENTIPNSKLLIINNFDEVLYYMASGFTCIFVERYSKYIVIETRSILDRAVSESSSEAIVKGPKDSFTENYMTNIGLIRKRIKDDTLMFTTIKIGTRTRTHVSITYINDLANQKSIDETISKIKTIDIDGVLDSSYIGEFLSPKQFSTFPKIISTERPDLVASSLLNGKICILVENTPYVLILPAVLTDFLHSPEDNYHKPSNASFNRFLRLMAFLVTLLTPALYIAVTTFNQEMLPDRLLISLAIQREGVPFPTPIEVLMLSITFEMLRESDIRIPKITGTAISVVGALVLGDAAVNAGIVSPIVVIIIAITSIAGLVFTDVDFSNAVRWWRLYFIVCASIMGIIGIVAGGIIFIAKLASLECLGVPYLTPISPLIVNDNKNSVIRGSKLKSKIRPRYLKTKEDIKVG